ncbi:MAG TPA: hypothetical protein VGW34_02325 [Allosphingosinicella sp.]|nr:hypothetical protein [Allosphingosinicella sp.]
MDAFSYLSVLISIILGLAVQQVLLGYRALILSRKRVRFYAPPLIWSGLMLLMVAQNWWASFGLADRADWSFAVFASILLQTVLIYMMAAIVLPDMPADQQLDLRDHYYRESRAFFGIAIAVIASSLLRDFMLHGGLPEPANLAFHGLFAAMALTVTITRRPRIHEAYAMLMAVLFVVYIALLFAELR